MNARRAPIGALLLIASLISAGLAAVAGAQGPRGYYRQPAVHGTTIVFVAEGDLWRIGVEGGAATRLTSHPGDESFPAVDPTGTWVAFIGSYEGPAEVYVMPIDGGLPTRLTFDGGARRTVGWTPDGRVMVTGVSRSTLPDWQLATIDVSDTTRPVTRPVPLAQAADGCYDGEGRSLFFTRQRFQGSHTRRYQGGTVPQIWRFDGEGLEAVPLTADHPGTSRTPMWHEGRVYFVSDRDGGWMNIWSMTADGGDVRRHTSHREWDVLGAALSGDRIVYRLGADLHQLDLATGATSGPLDITLRTDLDQMREQWIDSPIEYLTAAHVSADGSAVALTARGAIFVAPSRRGRFVTVDDSSDVRYREARFLGAATAETSAVTPATPDDARVDGADSTDAPAEEADDGGTRETGGTLVALGDRSGEVEVWTLPANGVGDGTRRTSGATVLRWTAVPSPDGRMVAHTDKDHRLFLLDLESGRDRLIEQSDVGDFGNVRWSPDSRWLIVERPASNLFTQLVLINAETGVVTPVTTDRFNSGSGCFSPDGRWLYLISERNLDSIVRSPWGAYQPEPYMPRQSRLYQLALTTDDRSPFAAPNELHRPDADTATTTPAPPATPDPGTTPESDLDPDPEPDPELDPGSDPESEPAEGTAASETSAPGSATGEEPEPVTIELDGLMERLLVVPAPPGAYSSLSVNADALFWLSRDPLGGDRALHALSITNKDPEPVVVAEKVTGYELSADGSTLLIRRARSLHLAPAKPAKADLAKTAVDLSGWRLSVTPGAQWRQMFVDAWRLQRDYFYDPAMHGVDWDAQLEKYLPLVERVTSRVELSDLLGQMMAELSALHIYVYGGDLRRGDDQVTAGGLGAALERDPEAGGWRVMRLYRHDPDEPQTAGPLRRPGARVDEGEVIQRINGRSTLDVPDPSVLLRGTAGSQVLLHVRGPAADDDVRPLIVTPLSPGAERGLRYTDWELERRARVEQESAGRFGYVHLRSMGGRSWADWARNFYPVFDREGLIVDVRHNTGGNIDSWILSRLMRKAWFRWSQRRGDASLWNMQFAFRGHVVVLCDEWTMSDGEAFAEGAKRLDLGTVIGTRTWGGEIWLSSSNVLLDRGIATAAEYGVYGPEGTWLVEGHGVDPDVVVDNLPHETFRGRDRQLEAAIEYLERRLADDPIEPLEQPDFPNKSN